MLRVIVFALAIFTGAFLLFLVQPLIGKFILPWFGGGPGVWTNCLLFFQVALVGGYFYAHLITRQFKPRTQALIHLILVGVALLLLPITPTESWKPHGGSDPNLQILLLLAATVGLPYFVLSATGPLVQHWFSQAKPGASPYRLYALSNAGSLVALLSYPFLVEPVLTRRAQAGFWGCGLVLYALFCGACAWTIWRNKAVEGLGGLPRKSASTSAPSRDADAVPRPAGKGSLLNRALWLILPACSSVLLMAITNKMCQDVAVIPFLWILPLALYLSSFIICFDSPRWYVRLPFTVALAMAIGGLVWVLPRANQASITAQLAIYATALFVGTMVCHGELYRLRPGAGQLTAFYLTISIGGALGGVFVALVAPMLFTDYFELEWGFGLCAGLLLLMWIRTGIVRPLASWSRPALGCTALGLVCVGVALWQQHRQSFGGTRVGRSRNFYGVLTLIEQDPQGAGLPLLQLRHGSTLHGVQLLEPSVAGVPTSYYSEDSGIGLAFKALPPGNRRIGLLGLGVGTLATYLQEGDYLRGYEINPEVARLAASRFTFLANCSGRYELVLGDGRLSLENEPGQNFDLLVLDAFSSDSIPVHLLTSEAFGVYERHMKPNGIIAVHLSNRHLDLEPVLAALAARKHLHTGVVEHAPLPYKWWTGPSIWMLLSRQDEFLNSKGLREATRSAHLSSTVSPWTDDFTSLYHILRRGAPQFTPGPAQKEVALATRLSEQRDTKGAIECYRRALELDPTSPVTLNNTAWLLAAGSEPGLRNGPEAVALAEKACRLTNYRQTLFVGTLAAAYAEAGRFPDAVSAGQKACTLASESRQEALLARNTELLDLYKSGIPYHEPAAESERR